MRSGTSPTEAWKWKWSNGREKVKWASVTNKVKSWWRDMTCPSKSFLIHSFICIYVCSCMYLYLCICTWMKAGWTGRRLRCVFLSHSFLLPSLLCTVFVFLFVFVFLWYLSIVYLDGWAPEVPLPFSVARPFVLIAIPPLLVLIRAET